VQQFFALGLDWAEQVLARFIEGLGALRLQIGCQLLKSIPAFRKLFRTASQSQLPVCF
jgi:hypothetical protein